MARDAIGRYPLFKLLSPRQLDRWLAFAEELTFATGETIFQKASAGVWTYLVLEGQVRVLREGATDQERSLGIFRPGELFGEYALLAPHRNTATCRATTPTRLLQLPLLPLRPVFQAMPGVGPNLKNWLRLHTLLHYLRGRAFLGFMSAPSGLALLDALRSETFAGLRAIQANGLAGDCWFVIEEGQVALHPPEGPVRELGPGDCFGEAALRGGGGLPLAVALTETRCFSLLRSAFAPGGQEIAHPSLQSAVPDKGDAAPYPWIGQQDSADCGVAALAMVAKSIGVDLSVEQVRSRVALGRHGASLMDLERAGKALGLTCRAVRVSQQQLGSVTPPFVAHLQEGHYVVVYEYGLRGVVIGDPATGVVQWSAALFAQACTGRLLLVGPAVAEEQFNPAIGRKFVPER